MSTEVQMDDKGRITIPAEIRSQLNLKPGEKLFIQITNDGISLKPKNSPVEMVKKAQEFRSNIKSKTNRPVGVEKLFED